MANERYETSETALSTGTNDAPADLFGPAVAFTAEGARVGFVTCLRCGAALLLSMTADSLGLHAAWHEAS